MPSNFRKPKYSYEQFGMLSHCVDYMFYFYVKYIVLYVALLEELKIVITNTTL